jgi:3-phosphoglycerate kinase
MKIVTIKELAQILFDTHIVKGMPLFASVLQYTSAKLVQKSRTDKTQKNPYPNAMKLSKVAIILNTDYEVAVTNQLVREDKEVTEYAKGVNTMPLTFGKNNQFVGLFKGEFVIQNRPNDNISPRTKYVDNGQIIDKDKIEAFLPAYKEASNQGTDREILWRKLYLSNVKKLTLNGETYKVIAD